MTWNVENSQSTFVNASKRTKASMEVREEANRVDRGREALNESVVNVLATSLQCLLLVSSFEGNDRTLCSVRSADCMNGNVKVHQNSCKTAPRDNFSGFGGPRRGTVAFVCGKKLREEI